MILQVFRKKCNNSVLSPEITNICLTKVGLPKLQRERMGSCHLKLSHLYPIANKKKKHHCSMHTSMMSSGNRKIEQPSFRATLIMYVAFNLFSSSTFTKQEEKKGEHNNSTKISRITSHFSSARK